MFYIINMMKKHQTLFYRFRTSDKKGPDLNLLPPQSTTCSYAPEENKATKNKVIRNLFRLKKENEKIQNKVIRDIGNLFEHEAQKKSL